MVSHIGWAFRVARAKVVFDFIVDVISYFGDFISFIIDEQSKAGSWENIYGWKV